MARFDLPLARLRTHRSASAEPGDFGAFWEKTLQEARQHPLDARLEPVDTGIATLRTFDVTFRGHGGHPVKGWLSVPAQATGPLPVVVQFIGYNGGRGPARAAGSPSPWPGWCPTWRPSSPTCRSCATFRAR